MCHFPRAFSSLSFQEKNIAMLKFLVRIKQQCARLVYPTFRKEAALEEYKSKLSGLAKATEIPDVPLPEILCNI